MKKKTRVFKSNEMNVFKDMKRLHMQCQGMTDKEKKYWQCKPYDLGGKKCEELQEN